ncbi:hypothetical protein SAMN05216228_10477 [Rhizobium tibeticum]|uniref:Uncharacterized protein n=2 Tax=Rhizobium tibeticum TaxID=501024 RepID=A0A1H8VTW8_9HYPH|nr:hypothetical protein RTCCBAU85039_6211 [Rhizobium tibeticum]SEP18667.1 hypothetical protein SAMN05216228_10477 [Rhizobium tibeticum]
MSIHVSAGAEKAEVFKTESIPSINLIIDLYNADFAATDLGDEVRSGGDHNH